MQSIMSNENLNDITEIDASEPSGEIKPRNVHKCNKCLKNSYRYSHDGFCGKCLEKVIYISFGT